MINIVIRLSCILSMSSTFVFVWGTRVGQIVGIPMETNGAPLIVDLFVFCSNSTSQMSLHVLVIRV